MGEDGGISWGRLVLGSLIGAVVLSVLLALVGPLVLVVATGGSSFRIRDDSMSPALEAGDWVLAEALVPGVEPPRGTVVAYETARRRGILRIMRVMGLPGEKIQFRGGAFYVDGVRAQMEELEDRVIPKRPPGRGAALPLCTNEPVGIDDLCHQEVWRETLPDGTSTLILNTRGKMGVFRGAATRASDDTEIFTVPAGKVFVLGDNRDSATDSRAAEHGLVDLHDLHYRVWLIHTSLDRSHRFFRLRLERFFTMVR